MDRRTSEREKHSKQVTTLFLLELWAAADIRDSHSRTPRNIKSTRILWKLPRVRAQSHATKRYLAVEGAQVTRVERIKTGPILCGVRLCCS